MFRFHSIDKFGGIINNQQNHNDILIKNVLLRLKPVVWSVYQSVYGRSTRKLSPSHSQANKKRQVKCGTSSEVFAKGKAR